MKVSPLRKLIQPDYPYTHYSMEEEYDEFDE